MASTYIRLFALVVFIVYLMLRDRDRTRKILQVTCILTCAASLLGCAGRVFWLFEMAGHFRPHYAIVLLTCAGGLVALKRGKLAALAVCAATLQLVYIVPLYRTDPANDRIAQNPRAQLRLISFNVHTDNEKKAGVVEYLKRENPDIFGLMEINDEWQESIHPLLTTYKHNTFATRMDNFGIGLYSRIPLREIEIVYFSREVPSIVARFDLEGQACTLILTHPLPPTGPYYSRERNAQFANISELRPTFDDRLILMGDLNSTSWSPYFQDLCEDTGLRDSRTGFGIQPT